MEKILVKSQRVRKSTSAEKNQKIDEYTLKNINYYSNLSDREISERIIDLDREWDVERYLETNMSVLALTGISLAITVDRKWLILPSVVLGFFAQHAIQGWCPPVSLFRWMKVRTREEIEREKHALKAIRGDYMNLHSPQEAFIATKQI